MKFRAKVIPSGNATAVEVPRTIVEALAAGPRPLIFITINKHCWRSRIALMRGLCLIGISAANRVATGASVGDLITIEVTLDTEPREVREPSDLTQALKIAAGTRASFDRLPYGLKKKEVALIEEAKSPEVRTRRISRLVLRLQATKS